MSASSSDTPTAHSRNGDDKQRSEAAATLPEAVPHTFRLSDGRAFSYYTFLADGDSERDDGPDYHPVLYLHGFPGCGLEGAVCAGEVAAARPCRLYAPDRPGFGGTEARVLDGDGEDAADRRMECAIEDLWEFVRHMEWETFSVIAVSGGGPYALALLASYLERQQQQQEEEREAPTSTTAKIEAISLVGGVCCTAGTEGMMPQNQKMFRMADESPSSWWSWTVLRVMFAVTSLAAAYLPDWLLMKGVPMDMPDVDRECLRDERIAAQMLRVLRESLRQGWKGAEAEARIVARRDPPPPHEAVLRLHFGSRSKPTPSIAVPRIAIFHGALDRNVPLAHAEYMRDELLGSDGAMPPASNNNDAVKFFKYDDLGHISLVVKKARDYAQFAAPTH